MSNDRLIVYLKAESVVPSVPFMQYPCRITLKKTKKKNRIFLSLLSKNLRLKFAPSDQVMPKIRLGEFLVEASEFLSE